MNLKVGRPRQNTMKSHSHCLAEAGSVLRAVLTMAIKPVLQAPLMIPARIAETTMPREYLAIKVMNFIVMPLG
jgi:hypothetical protein